MKVVVVVVVVPDEKVYAKACCVLPCCVEMSRCDFKKREL